MAGYRLVKSLSFRERSRTSPPVFTAMARYPSSLISYSQSDSSGNDSLRSRSIGKMKRACVGLSDRTKGCIGRKLQSSEFNSGQGLTRIIITNYNNLLARIGRVAEAGPVVTGGCAEIAG